MTHSEHLHQSRSPGVKNLNHTDPAHNEDVSSPRFTIKIPPMAPIPNYRPPLRRSSRQRHSSASQPSGSEYHESEKSMDMDSSFHHERQQVEEQPPLYTTSSRGRRIPQKSYAESADEDDFILSADQLFNGDNEPKSGPNESPYDEDEENQPSRYPVRQTRYKSKLNNVIHSDEDGRAGIRQTRSKPKKKASRRSAGRGSTHRPSTIHPDLPQRLTRSRAREDQPEEADYVDNPTSGSASLDTDMDADASLEDAQHSPSDTEADADGEIDVGADADEEMEQEHEVDGKPYALRQRPKVNYVLPPLEEMRPAKGRPNGGRAGGRSGHGGGGSRGTKGPPWSATGAELGRWMGMPADDSVRHNFTSLTFQWKSFTPTGLGPWCKDTTETVCSGEWGTLWWQRGYDAQRSGCCCWNTLEFRQNRRFR